MRGKARSVVGTGRPLARARAKRSTADRVKTVSRKLSRMLASDRPPVVAGAVDPAEAAAAAHLRYVTDGEPGIRRVGSPKRFRYVNAAGRPVRDDATLGRIRTLAIPPAWRDVWVCASTQGHIQAVGRDLRGRKQYRYHPRWREVRDRSKYGRMIELAQALPAIRRKVAADLGRPGLPREKVLAALVALLERTCIRVGCDEYARTNNHFGLTTLLDRHVQVSGSRVRFRFTGKSGKDHEVGLRDRRLARIVRNCQEVPGQRLFQYRDPDGTAREVDSGDVNQYLRELSNSDFTAKDFRTWAGTVFVAETLLEAAAPERGAAGKQAVLAAIDGAAERLGNTRTVCKGSYVHPAVLEAFSEGWLANPPRVREPRPAAALDPAEKATFKVLAAAANPRALLGRARAPRSRSGPRSKRR
jgi:DNA topoisomerase I